MFTAKSAPRVGGVKKDNFEFHIALNFANAISAHYLVNIGFILPICTTVVFRFKQGVGKSKFLA